MIPEIILGMVLMAFFYMMNLPFGMLTLLIGHTVFCVPYILMEVKARLAGMDPSLEEAARDLRRNTGLDLGIDLNRQSCQTWPVDKDTDDDIVHGHCKRQKGSGQHRRHDQR